MTTEDTPSVAETTAAGDQNDTGTQPEDIQGNDQPIGEDTSIDDGDSGDDVAYDPGAPAPEVTKDKLQGHALFSMSMATPPKPISAAAAVTQMRNAVVEQARQSAPLFDTHAAAMRRNVIGSNEPLLPVLTPVQQ
jgi:hypothetical protein